MAKLFYGTTTEPITVDDRMLAHVKVVVATKLRRGESFTLSWVHGPDQPVGRSTIWLQPSIPLRFVFDSEQPEALDQNLLKRMANDANSSRGLSLDIALDEPAAASAPVRPAPQSSKAARSLARAA
ncbi:von Willebrand factor A [Microbacterium sp. SUBG005]|nr:von Willebrand factor A [Microbacterium sp. SUBG005]